MDERGATVDDSIIYRCVQKYSPVIQKRLRWQGRRLQAASRLVGESDVKFGGKWACLHRYRQVKCLNSVVEPTTTSSSN